MFLHWSKVMYPNRRHCFQNKSTDTTTNFYEFVLTKQPNGIRRQQKRDCNKAQDKNKTQDRTKTKECNSVELKIKVKMGKYNCM